VFTIIARRSKQLVGTRSARSDLVKTVLALAIIACHLGCSSSSYYSRLRAQCDCEELGPLATAYIGMANHTTMVTTTNGTADGKAKGGGGGGGVKLAVHEIQPPQNGKEGRTVLFLHGIFSDHESWRFLAGDLGKDNRLLLVDLPGCGQSEKPRPTPTTEMDIYSPTAMARRVLEATQDRMSAAAGGGGDPGGPIMIIAHSLGGMMAIRMFGDPELRRDFKPLLDRVDRVVLIAPMDVSVARADPVFVKLATLSDFDVAMGSTFGFVDESVARGIFESVGHDSLAIREEADKRRQILCNAPTRHAMQAMLRTAIPRLAPSESFKPDWTAIQQLTAQYASVDVRCLIIWGAWDEATPLSMGYKMQAQLPRSELRVFPTSKHSPHIEQPAACIALIRDFLRPDSPIAAATHTSPGVPANVRAFPTADAPHAAGGVH
jgi:pimeloyl-ACP methyl ester carboxylesterase